MKTGLGENLPPPFNYQCNVRGRAEWLDDSHYDGNATSSTPAGLLNVIVPSNNLTFESIGGSLQIYRRYTPNSSKFQAAWKKAFSAYLASTQGKVYSQYVTDVNALNSLNELADTKSSLSKASNDWQAAAKAAEIKNYFPSFVAAFAKYANTYISEVKSNDKTFDQDVVNAYSDITAIQSAESSVIDQARGLLATVTYSYSTPPGKPATHDASAVASYVWIKKDAGAQITGNFGGSWFVSVPAGASYGHVKDYQFSAEFDQPLPASSANPRATLSFAGYGQYQYSANVLNVTIFHLAPGTNITVPSNSQVFASTPGWLGIAQAKLTFKIETAAVNPGCNSNGQIRRTFLTRLIGKGSSE